MEVLGNNENFCPDVLTGIHPSYTVVRQETGGTGELEELMVSHFLNTLAEVALSIASREVNGQ